jgi:hypothetical protein
MIVTLSLAAAAQPGRLSAGRSGKVRLSAILPRGDARQKDNDGERDQRRRQ